MLIGSLVRPQRREPHSESPPHAGDAQAVVLPKGVSRRLSQLGGQSRWQVGSRVLAVAQKYRPEFPACTAM